MKRNLLALVAVSATCVGVVLFLPRTPRVQQERNAKVFLPGMEKEQEMKAGPKRWQFEQMILADPRTGKIPANVRRSEIESVRHLPSKENALARNTNLNTYTACGPDADGGRTRALVPDVRYNGTSNRVIMAGGVNGGLYRTDDAGATWTWVNPDNEFHAVTAIAQDPRPGFQDTWYAAGGEYNGASASIYTAFLISKGIFKSTNNGVTWSRIDPVLRNNDAAQSPIAAGTLEGFDNPLDIVHRIAVHPTTGHVYVAGHRRILRSTNGGANFDVVLGSATAANSAQGQTEIIIKPDGSKIYAGICGDNPDAGLIGIWESTTGNVDFQGTSANWTRIAGGAANSPAGWNGPGAWSRIVLAIAPSNQNIMYALYENDGSVSSDADFFRCDLGTNTWTDRTNNLFALRNGTSTTFHENQGGYDLHVAVKPNDPNTVFIGGVNLFRSTDGFATSSTNKYVGGYPSNTYSGPAHPDYHFISFAPNDPNKMFVACDGGVYTTDNCSANTISWTHLNNKYQTFQYYHVCIDPTQGAMNFAGGTQDNATSFRDGTNVLSFLGGNPNPDDHWLLIGGDGAATAITSKDPANSNRQYMIGAYYEGNIQRVRMFSDGAIPQIQPIKPNGAGPGLFVTYFHLDPDNTNNLYFASTDTIYRTTSSTTVTSSTWTRMDGIASSLSGSIMSMATTRGGYTGNSYLFIGTSNGNLWRLKDPANASAAASPDNILNPGGGLITAGSTILDIAVNPRNHDTMMAVVSNYNVNSIFWTGNATSASPTWQVIEGGLSTPSIQSCEIVAKTTGIEYYVGTSVGLFSTTAINGNSTAWVREGTGPMKNAVVRSLAYRWNDNTLVVGTHGNGMFYTTIGDAITIVTGVNDPVRNDPAFIVKSWPSLSSGILNYRAGNMTGINKIRVEITDASGRLMMRREEGYTSNTLDIRRFPAGMYILTISNDTKRQQFVHRFVKQ
ncbi:MAG: T9SS type A sorting domain-containing protein [Dinghuibacter sp.]|nr:T9SS type A sorting domain-containing protein [Dinghuibacter sp.]